MNSHESYESALVEASPTSVTSDIEVLPRKTAPQRIAPQVVPFKKTSLRDRFAVGIQWSVVLWMIGMHAAALFAPFYFSWSGLAVCLGLHFVTACLGVTLGYHRLLTHGSFQTTSFMKGFFSICGMLSAEGSPLVWVATHREHHAHSDKESDPHSPREGFWWSHFLWFCPFKTADENKALFLRWAPDLYKDPAQRFFHHTFIFYPVILGFILYGVGQLAFGAGVSWVLWGLCLRMVLAYHSTWFVNSATHMWGYRNYETSDDSTNLWWVAILSYGEGWHNNHHAYQRLALHGHRWWEFDVTYNMIRGLRLVGLAWNLQEKLPSSHATGTMAKSA